MTQEAEVLAGNSVKDKIKPRLNIAEPSLYRVVYMNDDVTTMDFVIESLLSVFSYTYTDAFELTGKIHVEGSAVAAVLPYELAEQKGVEVTKMARAGGYPLVIKLEVDE
jgi:ATP-dependent Clp protease adaptor protein ClpS